jgi:hypothetical protein
MTRCNRSPRHTDLCRRISRELGAIARAVALVSAVLALTLITSAQQLDKAPLVLKARKCEIVVNVQWNRHDTSFPQKAEFSKVFAAVDGSGLLNRYTETSADHADLIFKLDDDALLDRITLEVLNPDDNSAVYSESRDRVALSNDVKRLIEHFLSAVDDARTAEKEMNQAETPGTSSTPSPQLLGLYGSIGGCEGDVFLYKNAALTGAPVALVTPATVLRVWPSGVGGSYSAQMEDFQTETVVHSGFVAERCLSKTWQAPSLPAPSGDRDEEARANAADPVGSRVNDRTPSYLWLGRFDREDKAQTAAKKVEVLGLPGAVVPRHGLDGDFFVVITGPYGPERIGMAMDWLKTQGFSDVRVIKNPLAAGNKEPN